MGRLIQRALLLAGCLALGAAVAIGWFALQSDELLRVELLRQLQGMLPDAQFSIERAQFDLRGRVRVSNFTLRLPDEADPSLIIPEVLVTLDRRAFADRQQILIEHVRISQPQVRVVRTNEGAWNWSRLQIVAPEGNGPLPNLEIQHATVALLLAGGSSGGSQSLRLEELHLSAKPSSARVFSVVASGRSDLTGTIRIDGAIPLDPAAWRVQASLQRLVWGTPIVALASRFFPELPARLDAGDDWLRKKIPALAGAPATRNTADHGLTFTTGLVVDIGQQHPQAPLEYRLAANIIDGRITHAVAPYPLRELQGTITYDGAQVLIRDLKASNGRTQLTINGRAGPQVGAALQIAGSQLPLDEATIQRLPASLQKHIRSLALTGIVSGTALFSTTDGVDWKIGGDATLTEATVTHERFPYTLRDVRGTLSWKDDTITMTGEGRGGQTPVTLTATLHNPGPFGDALYEIRATGAPIDEDFHRACPAGLKQALAATRLRGQADAYLLVMRPPGLDQKFETRLIAQVRQASMQYTGFPYAISDLSGVVQWSGDAVQFERLKGTHDGTILTGSGRYVGLSGRGQLTLDVSASNGAFDRGLYQALDDHLRQVWDTFQPKGQIGLTTHIVWSPGGPPRIQMPSIKVSDGAMLLREFPFPLQDVTGEFAYEPDGKLAIASFTARHDDMQLRAAGQAQCGKAWTLWLEQLHIDDLSPLPSFRRALMSPLREVVDTLNPVGRFSVDGPVTFHGPAAPQDPIRADWDLKIQVAGCSLTAGLRLDEVHGQVDLTGAWDGRQAWLIGHCDLDSLSVFRIHQLTKIRGPFRLKDQQLTVGSAEMAGPLKGDVAQLAPATARLVGQAYGGDAEIAAVVDFHGEPVYRAHLRLDGGNLENYAQQHLRGYNNVRGLMNGWMDLQGRGWETDKLEGRGQLQISPAALYELPVFLQIFQLPQFQPIDRAAFHYANFFFTIRNERYVFDAIDLEGRSISLRGRGTVRFDGAVALDFFTRQPPNYIRIPLLRELVGTVNQMNQNWIAVEVRGSIAAPQARVVPFPEFDAALKQLLEAVNPRPMAPPPTYRPPPVTSEPQRTPRR